MKFRVVFLLLAAMVGFAGCEKNSVSKIPNISLIASGPNVIRVNLDTAFVYFSITDGDADLGNDTVSVIYWKDSRYDSLGYIKAEFPEIDPDILDPKKGLTATCVLYPVPQPTPRLDSIHLATGDTFTYEIYIKDKAGHESNHITTPPIIITL